MSLLRRGFLAAALLLTGFLAIGFLLPGTWSAERSASVPASPDSVLTLLSNPERWEAWMPWPEGTEPLEETGAGSLGGFRWDDPHYGTGRFEIVSLDPSGQLRYRVSVEGGAVRIDGRIGVRASPEGTRIRWREEGDFGRNPLMGYTALTMEEEQGRQLEAILERLRAELGA